MEYDTKKKEDTERKDNLPNAISVSVWVNLVVIIEVLKIFDIFAQKSHTKVFLQIIVPNVKPQTGMWVSAVGHLQNVASCWFRDYHGLIPYSNQREGLESVVLAKS